MITSKAFREHTQMTITINYLIHFLHYSIATVRALVSKYSDSETS
jgi:hypothetical protein